MTDGTVQETVELDPEVHRALREKAMLVHRSVSEIVNDALREALREDEEDLAAIAERAGEPLLTLEAFATQLKADGTL